MQSRRRVFVLAAALAAILSLSASAEAGGGPWTVVFVEGAAKLITGGGAAEALVAGQPVTGGVAIATSEDGRVVVARRGDSITVLPNSRMTIPPHSGEEGSGVLQSLGRLLFRMESRESRDFEVKTPHLAAAIKGTIFTVDVDADESAVSVSEGVVLVTANASGDSVHVGAGQRVRVNRNSPGEVQLGARDESGAVPADQIQLYAARDGSGGSGAGGGSGGGSGGTGSGGTGGATEGGAAAGGGG